MQSDAASRVLLFKSRYYVVLSQKRKEKRREKILKTAEAECEIKQNCFLNAETRWKLQCFSCFNFIFLRSIFFFLHWIQFSSFSCTIFRSAFRSFSTLSLPLLEGIINYLHSPRLFDETRQRTPWRRHENTKKTARRKKGSEGKN